MIEQWIGKVIEWWHKRKVRMLELCALMTIAGGFMAFWVIMGLLFGLTGPCGGSLIAGLLVGVVAVYLEWPED